MYRTIRENIWLIVLLVYILLCMLIGGASRERLFAHGLLHGIAAFGIATLILSWPRSHNVSGMRMPIYIVVGVLFLGLLQTISLPAGFWAALPGRDKIIEGYMSLEVHSTSLPITLNLEASIQSLSYTLTPLFVLLLSARVGLRRLQRVVPAFMICFAALTVLLGLSQVYDGRDSDLYLFENTNYGAPVGFFANVNHFAALLLMTVPFAILVLRELPITRSSTDHTLGLAALLASILILIMVGIGAAGSLAIYIISVPSISLAFIGSRNSLQASQTSRVDGLILIVIFIVATTVIVSSPVLDNLGVIGAAEDPTSRQNMWSYTVSAIEEFWPIGSGVGTYESVIPAFENSTKVSSRYFAFAHNEYLQITMEYGAAGVIAMVISLGWLYRRATSIWLRGQDGKFRNFQRMALIGVIVCLLHSVVDYPARTPAIAAFLSLLIGVISLSEDKRGFQQSYVEPDDPKRVVL